PLRRQHLPVDDQGAGLLRSGGGPWRRSGPGAVGGQGGLLPDVLPHRLALLAGALPGDRRCPAGGAQERQLRGDRRAPGPRLLPAAGAALHAGVPRLHEPYCHLRYPMRADLEIIQEWIPAGSRVLGLGCGTGELLAWLRDHKQVTGYGLEIDPDNIARCIERGVNVIEQDLDKGLGNFASDSFDMVVMTQALQAVHYPDLLLKEMLRVGRECIITSPTSATGAVAGIWPARAACRFQNSYRTPGTTRLIFTSAPSRISNGCAWSEARGCSNAWQWTGTTSMAGAAACGRI